MSWETLIVGSFRVKEGSDVDRILKDARSMLECSILYSREWKEFEFSDVNWASHVNADSVNTFLDLHKDELEYYSISLYYLGEPDETWTSE